MSIRPGNRGFGARDASVGMEAGRMGQERQERAGCPRRRRQAIAPLLWGGAPIKRPNRSKAGISCLRRRRRADHRSLVLRIRYPQRSGVLRGLDQHPHFTTALAPPQRKGPASHLCNAGPCRPKREAYSAEGDQPSFCRLTAAYLPRRSTSISNCRRSPSFSEPMPARSTAEMCTNASGCPSSR